MNACGVKGFQGLEPIVSPVMKGAATSGFPVATLPDARLGRGAKRRSGINGGLAHLKEHEKKTRCHEDMPEV